LAVTVMTKAREVSCVFSSVGFIIISGTFQIPVDSFQKTSDGSVIVIATSEAGNGYTPRLSRLALASMQ
jgi:hypothetical protein